MINLRATAMGPEPIMHEPSAPPTGGWAMLWAGGYPMMLSESLRRHAHGFFALLTFLTFLAPMGAALYHGLIRRDGVLLSMAGRRAP